MSMSRTPVPTDVGDAGASDVNVPGGGEDRRQPPALDGGDVFGVGRARARGSAGGPSRTQADSEAGGEPARGGAETRPCGRRGPGGKHRQRDDDGALTESRDVVGAPAGRRRASASMRGAASDQREGDGGSGQGGLAIGNEATIPPIGNECSIGDNGGEADVLQSRARSSHSHPVSLGAGSGQDLRGGDPQPSSCRQPMRRGRQPGAANGSPQARLRRRRGPSSEWDPMERSENTMSHGRGTSIVMKALDTPRPVVGCARSDDRLDTFDKAHDPPPSRALPADRRGEVTVEMGHRGDRHAEDGPSQAAAASGGPAALAADPYLEDGVVHGREATNLAPEAAPNVKRRRIRGKQSTVPKNSAADVGAARIDVQDLRWDEKGDEAAHAFASRLNSLHDGAAAGRGSGLDHRDEVPGRSPSRLAFDCFTEQLSSCPGHRDGLQPSARRGPADTSWPAWSGRPPDAADAAA